MNEKQNIKINCVVDLLVFPSYREAVCRLANHQYGGIVDKRGAISAEEEIEACESFWTKRKPMRDYGIVQCLYDSIGHYTNINIFNGGFAIGWGYGRDAALSGNLLSRTEFRERILSGLKKELGYYSQYMSWTYEESYVFSTEYDENDNELSRDEGPAILLHWGETVPKGYNCL